MIFIVDFPLFVQHPCLCSMISLGKGSPELTGNVDSCISLSKPLRVVMDGFSPHYMYHFGALVRSIPSGNSVWDLRALGYGQILRKLMKHSVSIVSPIPTVTASQWLDTRLLEHVGSIDSGSLLSQLFNGHSCLSCSGNQSLQSVSSEA